MASFSSAASSSSSMALHHHHHNHHNFVFLPLFLFLALSSTNAMPIDGVDDVQQWQRQPFALFALTAQESDENGGSGSPSLMAKRHLAEILAREGRSPRSASSATMRNALVRFGKRALLPSNVLDDKRNPPQPFVRFGRSASNVAEQQIFPRYEAEK